MERPYHQSRGRSWTDHALAARIDHAAMRALLADCLPAERHQRLVPLGEGDFCLAFREGTRVVRVARHPEAAAALRTEACVLACIAERLPLPVPRPTHHAPHGCPPFSVHEEVRGEVLTRDGWLALPLVARRRIAAELAVFLRALHDLDPEAVRSCGVGQIDRRELAARLREDATDTVYPLLDPDTRRKLDQRLARSSTSSMQEDRPTALLHRDLAPGHILFDPDAGHLTGIIDFGDVVLGDPARDFIYIYEDFGAELLTAVLSSYPREQASVLLPRIRHWYLLEALVWTIQMIGEHREAETREGMREIIRELATPGSIPA